MEGMEDVVLLPGSFAKSSQFDICLGIASIDSSKVEVSKLQNAKEAEANKVRLCRT